MKKLKYKKGIFLDEVPSKIHVYPTIFRCSFQKVAKKQVIGLADTLKILRMITSSFNYFTYMKGTGPCDSSKIIFGNHVFWKSCLSENHNSASERRVDFYISIIEVH